MYLDVERWFTSYPSHVCMVEREEVRGREETCMLLWEKSVEWCIGGGGGGGEDGCLGYVM